MNALRGEGGTGAGEPQLPDALTPVEGRNARSAISDGKLDIEVRDIQRGVGRGKW